VGLQVNIYKGCTKGKAWPFIMHPALLGTDLSIPPPVNNLTSLASDFNWVEEMALLTRFHPDNRVMWFGDQVWKKCEGNAEKAISGEEATQNSGSGTKADHETGSQVNSNCSERELNRENVDISSDKSLEVPTVRPRRKKDAEPSTPLRPQLRRPVLPLKINSDVKSTQSKGGSTREHLDPAEVLASSFDKVLALEKDEEICPKTAAAQREDTWEPLWMREAAENSSTSRLTCAVAPHFRGRVRQPVGGRAIWSPPKGSDKRGTSGKMIESEGRGSPLAWSPSEDSFLS